LTFLFLDSLVDEAERFLVGAGESDMMVGGFQEEKEGKSSGALNPNPK